MNANGAPVGLVLGSQIPPEKIVSAAVLGEELGFSELWLAEDYFFTGGISGAAAALSATKRIPVGLGIVSAMVRHPALLAMECSTMERMFPGRFWPGIGLGLPHWVKQMHLYPKSQLGALRESVGAVRRLLEGEELTEQGASFGFDAVKLAYPASGVPIYMGVLGPKMLRLAGEIADGTVVSVLASAEYVRWAREQIAEGQRSAGRSGHHRLPTFAMFSCDHDSQKAKDALRPVVGFYLSLMPQSPLGDAFGITDQLKEMVENGGAERITQEMPDEWLTGMNVVGDPDECAAQIRKLMDAGADSVVLFPTPVDRMDEIVRLAGKEVLPRV